MKGKVIYFVYSSFLKNVLPQGNLEYKLKRNELGIAVFSQGLLILVASPDPTYFEFRYSVDK